jgi:hypothetical protein
LFKWLFRLLWGELPDRALRLGRHNSRVRILHRVVGGEENENKKHGYCFAKIGHFLYF